jgi:hypothetical protein
MMMATLRAYNCVSQITAHGSVTAVIVAVGVVHMQTVQLAKRYAQRCNAPLLLQQQKHSTAAYHTTTTTASSYKLQH